LENKAMKDLNIGPMGVDMDTLIPLGKDESAWDKEREPVIDMFHEVINDVSHVVVAGGEKHGYSSWKDEDNPSLQHMSSCDSLFHHLTEVRMGVEKDKDSGLDPMLHLITRAMMMYTRKVRGYDK
jgi:hypothetical protein